MRPAKVLSSLQQRVVTVLPGQCLDPLIFPWNLSRSHDVAMLYSDSMASRSNQICLAFIFIFTV
jgi:hypothetical protein